jgi:hypothetical protein
MYRAFIIQSLCNTGLGNSIGLKLEHQNFEIVLEPAFTYGLSPFQFTGFPRSMRLQLQG